LVKEYWPFLLRTFHRLSLSEIYGRVKTRRTHIYDGLNFDFILAYEIVRNYSWPHQLFISGTIDLINNSCPEH
jgi:hypothetical protein